MRPLTPFKNFFILFSSGFLELGTMMLLIALLTRYLGVELFGIYSLTIALVAIMQPLLSLQLHTILIREFGHSEKQEHRDKLLTSGITVRTVMFFVLLAVLVTISPFLGLNIQQLITVYILFITEAVIINIRVLYSIFLYHEKMIFNASLNILLRLLQLIFSLSVIYFGLGIREIILAYSAAGLISSIATILVVKHFFSLPRWNFDKDNFLFIFKESLTFGIGVFINQLLFRVDIVFLNALGTINDVAFYSAPHRLIFNVRLFAMSMLTALMPKLVKILQVNEENLPKLLHQIFQLLLIVSIPIQIVTFFYSSELMELFFGGEFTQAANAMLIIGQSVLFLIFLPFFTIILLLYKDQRKIPLIAGTSLIINSILDYLFIPKFGYMGAAYATIIAYGISCTAYCVQATKHIGIIPISLFIKPVLAGLCMTAVIFPSKSQFPPIIIGSSLLCYVIVLILLKAVSLRQIRKLLSLSSTTFPRKGSKKV